MTDLLDAARRVVESTYRKNTRMDPMPGAVDDLEAALEAYEWTDEPPSEPGWYFYRLKIIEGICGVAEVYESSTGLRLGTEEAPLVSEIGDNWELAGPIPEPTDPKS